MCSYLVFSSLKSGLVIVVKSLMFAPVTSISSDALLSTDFTTILYIGSACFFVPLTVMMFFISCLIGFNLSILMASVEIKFLLDPVSKNAHNVSSFDTTGIIGGSVSSGEGA